MQDFLEEEIDMIKTKAYKTKRPFKGVYEKDGGKKFQAVIWEATTGRLTYHGSYGTFEHADYVRTTTLHGHHWHRSSILDADDYFGFIYLMTNVKTGKKYIGSKQLYFWDGPVGGFKCTDPKDEWFDRKAWRESDWRYYTGSSKEINMEISKGNVYDFRFEILEGYHNKLELHLGEIRHQQKCDVLEATDSLGNYLYYNKNISGCIFRPPYSLEEAKSLREKEVEDMRNYYLKPTPCGTCGKIIPFASSKCMVCEPPVEISFG